MTRAPVTSSNIRSIGYDAEQRMLEVEFQNNAVYRYQGVTPEEHAELMSAESVGAHFAAGIRKSYKGVRVEE